MSFISAISDCVFILSCLCSSIRLQEKPSWRGQSSCAWLITNGAVVQWLQGLNRADLKPNRQRRVLHKSNLPITSRKIGPDPHHVACRQARESWEKNRCLN